MHPESLLAIVRLDPPSGQPVVDHPREDRRVEGCPRRETWTMYESATGDLSVGQWTCEPGRWRILFAPTKDEVFFVLEGRVRLHDVRGNVTEVGPGESAVIPAGFEGEFEVVERVRKHFVVVER